MCTRAHRELVAQGKRLEDEVQTALPGLPPP
jgi:hypothetical protein